MSTDTGDEAPLKEDADLRRMRWRCRRGMRELDQLMLRWLDQRWATSSEAQRGVFRRLLDSEDDRLWRWFLGDRPEDDQIDAIVQDIRTLSP